MTNKQDSYDKLSKKKQTKGLQSQIPNQYPDKKQENNRILQYSHSLVTQKYPPGHVSYG